MVALISPGLQLALFIIAIIGFPFVVAVLIHFVTKFYKFKEPRYRKALVAAIVSIIAVILSAVMVIQALENVAIINSNSNGPSSMNYYYLIYILLFLLIEIIGLVFSFFIFRQVYKEQKEKLITCWTFCSIGFIILSAAELIVLLIIMLLNFQIDIPL